MNWDAFWSGLIGTTIPALTMSVFMLYLTHRSNRALEGYRKRIEQDLANHQFWHQKRVLALLAIYEEFRKYLDFLRRVFYIKSSMGFDVTPMHDFHNAIETHLVYFNDELRQIVLTYKSELLEFWNWAIHLRTKENEDNWGEVQKRLDYEIPVYLEKIRIDINKYSDPSYKEGSL